MTQDENSLLNRMLPWSREVVWWLIMIQGIVALVIGLFMLLVQGTGFIPQMIGLFILIEGSVTIYRVFRDMRIDQDEVYRLMRAMVGITAGLITFTTPMFVGVMLQRSALMVLVTAMATGLVLEGLIGLWALVQADSLRTRVINTLVAITFLGLGIVYYLQVTTFTNLLPWLGLIMSVIGGGLTAYAFYVRSHQTAATGPVKVEPAEVEPAEVEPAEDVTAV